MNKKVIISSALSLAMCASMVTGATFALFTSEAKTNIAVTAGNVEVVATIDRASVYTKELNTEYTKGASNTYMQSVTVGEQSVTLDGFVPGDGVKFTIDVENKSNVSVQYRTKLLVEEDSGLFEGLTITVDGAQYEGDAIVSVWSPLVAYEDIANVEVEIEFKADRGNEYRNKSCKIVYLVEAVQGNATTENEEEGVTYIYTKKQLKAFADEVNGGNTFDGKTVALGGDIDLEGEPWEPIGYAVITNNKYDWDNSPHFAGTFDGKGYTISNLNVDDIDTNIRGLFGYGKIKEIKNLHVHNASVRGLRRSAVLVGQNDGSMNVSNVRITGDVKVEVAKNEAGTLVGRGGLGNVSDVVVDVNAGSYVKCSVTNTNSWEYVGGVWGHAWPSKAVNVSSNIDVYAYASATGGIGGGGAGHSENVTCSGNVTIAYRDTEIHKGTIECWQTNGTIYGFGVGSSNKATHINCSSTGTLTVAGVKISDIALNSNGYQAGDVRFGAAYYLDGVIEIVD